MAKMNTEFAKCERLSETVSIEVVFTETMYVTHGYFEEISCKLSEQETLSRTLPRFGILNMVCLQANKLPTQLLSAFSLNVAPDYDNVEIIGEDLDFLVILFGF